jgi:DNA-binding SARP family transcriptional activator
VLELRLLGPLEIVRDGRPVRLVGKPAVLLVALLIRRNEVVSTDRLLDELWDERPPKSAHKLLQAYVSQLRKALGSERVQTFPNGYSLAVSPEELDLARFEQLLRDADRAGDSASASGALDDALALWRGPPLADVREEPFARTAADRLEALHVHALEARFDVLLGRGEDRALVPELEALVDRHPLHERLRGQLMVALYRSGRQADALARYRAGRETLVNTLGIEPSRSLRAVHEAILRQDEALEAVPAASQASLLVANVDDTSILEQLARAREWELLLMRSVPSLEELQAGAAALESERERLVGSGLNARVAAFRSTAPARELARIAERPGVELALVGVTPEALGALDGLAPLLQRPACDVALLVEGTAPAPGPVVVAFGGGDNDWAALELGVALAQAGGVQLVLAGGSRNGADASPVLAAASLAVQRVAGVVAQPRVVPSGSVGLRGAAEGATALLLGLPDDWRERGLGDARTELALSPPAPLLLVRRGVRVGKLGAESEFTQFTWSR